MRVCVYLCIRKRKRGRAKTAHSRKPIRRMELVCGLKRAILSCRYFFFALGKLCQVGGCQWNREVLFISCFLLIRGKYVFTEKDCLEKTEMKKKRNELNRATHFSCFVCLLPLTWTARQSSRCDVHRPMAPCSAGYPWEHSMKTLTERDNNIRYNCGKALSSSIYHRQPMSI